MLRSRYYLRLSQIFPKPKKNSFWARSSYEVGLVSKFRYMTSSNIFIEHRKLLAYKSHLYIDIVSVYGVLIEVLENLGQIWPKRECIKRYCRRFFSDLWFVSSLGAYIWRRCHDQMVQRKYTRIVRRSNSLYFVKQ